ncbi:MAG TPA: hemerythrin domain-containing protein [Nitrospira sp.]|nr:hemerythrin domain-containing protein [Nitrospira sp.]
MPKRDSGKTQATSSSKKTRSTDAIQMLKDDHRKVEALFDQFLEEEGGKKQQTAQQIFHELEVHSTLEEELFYPAFQNRGNPAALASLEQGEEPEREETMDATEFDEDEHIDGDTTEEDAEEMIAGSYDDHRVVRDMIAELRNNDASSLEFRQSMIQLQQTVMDHVSQEEDELFPQAQLSIDIKTLGMHMQQRRHEILSAVA